MVVKKEPAIIVQKYKHIEAALFNLISGNVDALIFPEPNIWNLVRTAGIEDKIKVAGEPLVEVRCAISVSKRNKALLMRINDAVKRLVRSDVYRQIYIRWYGKPKPFWNAQRAAGSLITVLIGLFFFMSLWRYKTVNNLNFTLVESLEELTIAQRQLKAANDKLEQKIEARTAQLTDTIRELEILFNNSQVGIMVLKGGRFLYRGNQRLADILGYNHPLEMQGFSMRKLHLTEKHFHEFGDRYFDQLRNKKMLQIEYQLKHKDGTPVWCTLSGKALDSKIPADLNLGVVWVIDDISNKKQNEIEREQLVSELKNTLREVKQLKGLLPICSYCRKIRDDNGYWNEIDAYFEKHSDVVFSHGICQDCVERYYPDYDIYGE